jgi:asparagine synthase (glutamine-hydrolysing)
MCGLIAAFGVAPGISEGVRLAMARMHRRGPDDEGFWQQDGACLGHRRLAILDLDHRAAQPMHSADGRYVIVYNGEIYNFRELRRALETAGETFRTTSDTEVILTLFAREGAAMLPKLRGMFAFVIWDTVARCAFAARDPYGIKPLYLARISGGWMFASQVKALLATGLVSREPDPQGQSGFWLLGSVPEPHTWYRDIQALPAGSWCRVTAEHKLNGPHSWFDIGDCWREAPECRATPREAQERVRAVVRESVRAHLVADVPVGVFLSGGIDSGSLAGLMKDAGATDVQGVTIAFKEFAGTENDESPVAARIAAHYGIQHHIRTVTRAEFEADLSRILDAMDQPSIDGINTWYASKAVAELGLKVVVSGVGGDELFHGYSTFRDLPALVSRWRRVARIPGSRAAAGVLANLQARRSGNPRWRWFTRTAGSLYGAYWLRRGLFSPDQLPELAGTAATEQYEDTIDPAALVQSLAGELAQDSAAAVGQLESMAYLRNQLLRDSDWASMDHSVELRTPLVDTWLLRELAPLLRGFGRLHGKALLARAPSTPLADDIIHRSKTGFGIPVERWLREAEQGAGTDGGSRGWAQSVVERYDSALGRGNQRNGSTKPPHAP